MKNLIFKSLLAVVIMCFAISCNEETVLPDTMNDFVPITRTEYENKVCGYAWVKKSVLRTYTDDNPFAIPLFEDRFYRSYISALYFSKDSITIHNSQSYDNAQNSYISLDISASDGNICTNSKEHNSFMNIYYVDDKEMRALVSAGIENGKHIYNLSVFNKLSNAQYDDLKARSYPYAQRESIFDYDTYGIPCCFEQRNNQYVPGLELTVDQFCKEMVGATWVNFENYEILSQGFRRQTQYPYGHAEGTKIDFTLNSDSVITITRTSLVDNKQQSVETCPYRFVSSGDDTGRNDIVYTDSHGNTNILRIYLYGKAIEDKYTTILYAIICENGIYRTAKYERR